VLLAHVRYSFCFFDLKMLSGIFFPTLLLEFEAAVLPFFLHADDHLLGRGDLCRQVTVFAVLRADARVR
jgi:hypothetical protein